jgi:transmembrane sensor
MNRTTRVPPSDIESIAADWIVRRDAGVSAAEERAFERWQAADPRHAAAVARHEKTWGVLDRPLRAGQGDWLLQQLRSRASRRRRQRVAAASAALAIVLLAGMLWRQERPAASTVLAPPTTPAVNAVVVGPEKRMLPDGSSVELRVGSDFTFDFSGPLRQIVLRQGEAHFDVAKNPGRPFVVAARGLEVRALGTAFSVQIGASEVEVLVTHGTVAVEQPRAASTVEGTPASPARLATVEAGRRVVVDLTDGKTNPTTAEQISAAELDERLAWRAPRLDFSDTRLAEAIALMNRLSVRKPAARFVIVDSALNDVRLSGLFRADNTDTFVRILEASFGVKAEQTGDIIALRKAR